MITHDDVRAIARSLPGYFEQGHGGRPLWRTEELITESWRLRALTRLVAEWARDPLRG